jgi:hypothetical protein
MLAHVPARWFSGSRQEQVPLNDSIPWLTATAPLTADHTKLA